MKSGLTALFTLVMFLSLLIFSMASHAEEKLYPLDSDTEAYYFGGSVSISGIYAIIGANGVDQSAGAAYIFQRASNGSWARQQKLIADATFRDSSDKFGTSVSISGVYAIVGAPYDDDDNNGSNSGSAYIFKQSGTVWNQECRIKATDGARDDFFGGSVSLWGDYAIVGAAYDDDKGSESGSAYIFKREGTSWIEEEKLIPDEDDRESGDYFGSSVSISGQDSEWYAIVGAHLSNDADTNTNFGAAYIFKKENESWKHTKKLTADDGAIGDNFGRSVSISGQNSQWRAIVGADGDDIMDADGDEKTDSGSAYIFRLENSSLCPSCGNDTWTQQAKLTAGDDAAAGDRFGRSVAISGDHAIAGAYQNDDRGNNAGAVFIFEYLGTGIEGETWNLQEKKTAADGDSGDAFGSSVSISDYFSIAGAPGADNNVGSARIYNATGGGGTLPPTIQNPGDQTLSQNTSKDISVTIFDFDTPANGLSVSVSAYSEDYPGLIPNNTTNIRITHDTGDEYILHISPAASQAGTATITVTADDHDNSPRSISFTLSVNDPPLISGLPESVAINENDSTEQIRFTLEDSVTSPAQITVSGDSSDISLVPAGSISFTGTAETRFVTVTPASGMTGSAEITISAKDTDGDTSSETFTLLVNGAPGISGIKSEEVTDEDVPVYINFTVDAETAANPFDISAAWFSMNMSEAGLTIIGTGNSRRLDIIPPTNEFGNAWISVSVRNYEGGITTKTFSLEVRPVNDKPTVSDPSGGTVINEDTEATFSFTMGDVDTRTRNLTLSATSANTTLVPDQNISISGTDADRTVTISPHGYGTADITVKVSDGSLEDETTFTVTVNARPLISGPGDNPTTDEDKEADFFFGVSDPDDFSDSLTLTAVSDDPLLIPNNTRHIQFSGSGESRRLTITPGADQFGQAEVTVTVSDDNGAQRETRFFLTVKPINDPPTVSWIGPQQSEEDGWTDKIAFTVTDVEGGSLTLKAASGNLNLIPDSNDNIRMDGFGGTNYPIYAEPGVPIPVDLTLLPASNQYGTADITISATDAQDATEIIRFPLTIGSVNDPPSISDIGNQTTDEDVTLYDISFTVTDSDPDTLTLSVSSDNPELIPPANIRIIGVNADNQIRVQRDIPTSLNLAFTPVPDQSGTAEITVNVDDGTATATDTFVLTVEPVNDPPEISNIERNLTITEDTSETFSFIVGDPDTPVEYLRVTVTSPNTSLVPSQYANIHAEGTGANRTLFVKPAKDADTSTFGIADITVTVTDDQDASAEERLFLRVSSVNDAPTITGTPALTVNEEIPYLFTPNADDIDNTADDLFFTIEHKPSWANFDEQTGVLSGVPGDSDVGRTTGIVITVTDPEGEKAALPPFDIEVLNVNDPPVVSDIGNQVTDEDVPTDPIRFTVQDLEGGRLLISASSSDTTLVPNNAIDIGGYGPNYVVTTLPGEERELSVSLTPGANQSGTATITIRVNDGTDTTPANFYLMVRPVNDGPDISMILNQSTDEDTPTENIAFTVTDPEGGVLRVTAVSDVPSLVPESGIDIIGTDSEGRINASPDQAVSLQIKITPAEGESGEAFITVTADDGDKTDTTKFLLSVNYVNKLPVISDIQSKTTDEDTPVDVTFTVSDIEGGNLPISVLSADPTRVPNDPEHISIITASAGGVGFGPNYVLSLPPTGSEDITVRLTPAENQTGPVSFSVTVSDSGRDTDPKNFFITVRPLNDAPVISGIPNQNTSEDVPVENIPFSVGDSEGGMFDGGILKLAVTSSNPDLIPADADHIQINSVPPTGSGFGFSHDTKLSPGVEKSFTLTLIPAEGKSGAATITVQADDGSGTGTAISEKTFLLTVNYINKPPVLSGLYNRTTAEDESIDVIFTVSDVEGGGLPISVTSSDSALVPNAPENISINGLGSEYILTMGPDDMEYPILTLTPAANQVGSTKITVTVKDGDNPPVEKAFYLTVVPRNDAPTLSPISNYSTSPECAEDAESCDVDVNFTVSDLEGGLVIISADSSDGRLVPNDDIHIDIGGFGTEIGEPLSAGGSVNITLTLQPESGVIPSEDDFGNAEITVTARDEEGGETSRTFTLQVDRTNKPPRITGLWDKVMDEDQDKLDVTFNISDDEGGQMDIKVESSDTNVIPNDYAHLSIEGYGPDYALIMTPGAPAEDLTLSITPASDKFGVAIITVRVYEDGVSEAKAKETMLVNVRPVNDEPSVSAIPNQTTSEGQVTGSIPFTVSDLEGGLLDISVTSSDTDLVPEDDVFMDISGFGQTHTVTPSPGENISLGLVLLPASDEFGTADITVTVKDREGGEDSKTFKLMVGVVNEPPILSTILSQITTEDTPTGSIPFTVSDSEGGALAVSVTSSDSALVPNDDAHIQIIDGEDIFGAIYILNLEEGTDTASLGLNIIPAENLTGSAIITITVTDGDASDTKSFTISVDPTNDPPEIIPDSIPITFTSPGTQTQPIEFAVTDHEGGMLEISVTSTNKVLVPEDIDHIVIDEGFGTVHKINTTPGEKKELTLLITPAEGEVGETYIGVKVSDSDNASREIAFTVRVANQPPEITGNAYQDMNEDGGPFQIPFTVSDSEGGNLVISVTSSNENLVQNMSIEESGLTYELQLEAGQSQELSLAVEPEPDAFGETTLTVTVKDEGEEEVEKEFILNVNPVNDLPQISEITNKTTNENTTAEVSFMVSDKDTPSADLDITMESSETDVVPNGSIILSGSGANRTLRITPAQDKLGDTIITVTVSDGSETNVSEDFTLTVANFNTPPVIESIPSPQWVEENASATIEFTVSDGQTDAGDLSVSAVSLNSRLVPNISQQPVYLPDIGKHTMEITPAQDETGNAPITIIASDGAETVEVTFTLQVIPIDPENRPPEIIGTFSPRYTNEDEKKIIKFKVQDEETSAADIDVSAHSDDLNIVPNENISLSCFQGDCTMTIFPVENKFGDARITVVAEDGYATTEATFTLRVLSINDRPTISPPIENQAIAVGESPDVVLFDVSDVETGVSALYVSARSSNTRLVPEDGLDTDCLNGKCELRISPVADRAGSTEITVRVDDGGEDNNSWVEESFLLTVGQVLSGDVDGNKSIQLRDAILALKTLAGIDANVIRDADVNGDGKIGMAEVLYILRDIAGK